METVKQRFFKIVKKKGLTIVGLAKEMGLTRQAMYKKLSLGKWTEEELRKYADILGCDVEITFIDRETGERI